MDGIVLVNHQMKTGVWLKKNTSIKGKNESGQKKCQYVGRIRLNVNAEKKIVNSDFNLKLGKIQCEGKINKQTKKNLQNLKFRQTDQKPEFETSQYIIKMKYYVLCNYCFVCPVH
jgi:hypothetical protein